MASYWRLYLLVLGILHYNDIAGILNMPEVWCASICLFVCEWVCVCVCARVRMCACMRMRTSVCMHTTHLNSWRKTFDSCSCHPEYNSTLYYSKLLSSTENKERKATPNPTVESRIVPAAVGQASATSNSLYTQDLIKDKKTSLTHWPISDFFFVAKSQECEESSLLFFNIIDIFSPFNYVFFKLFSNQWSYSDIALMYNSFSNQQRRSCVTPFFFSFFFKV